MPLIGFNVQRNCDYDRPLTCYVCFDFNFCASHIDFMLYNFVYILERFKCTFESRSSRRVKITGLSNRFKIANIIH